MFSSKKALLLVLLLATSLFVAACSAEPEIVEKIVEVTVETIVEKEVEVEGETIVVTEIVIEEKEVVVEVEVTPEGMDEEMMEDEGGEIVAYTIGIFEDPLTLNTWSQLGPDNSVWTSYVLSGREPTLYTYSDQRSDWVPHLAADLSPAPVEEDDGTYSITVEMLEGPQWSDGEAIDANDVAFTLQTCLDLSLTGNWNSICKPEITVGVEAVDDYTVKFYFNALPGLAQWQFGVAFMPILPEHQWADTISEAYSFVDGLELPEDCSDEAPEENLEACEAYENARKTLYGASLDSYVTAGGYTSDKLEPGAFAQRDMNDNYFFSGRNIVQTDDGQYLEVWADGSERSYYGDGSGEETLNFVEGPYSPNVIFSIYGSQDAAYLALNDGEVDYVLNPLGANPGLIASAGPNVANYTNADNGVFYMAFNMRKEPFSDQAFRTAVDILIDKEFVTGRILQGTVFPAYSVVPEGNAFWHQKVETPWVGMSREERVNMAKETLLAAGYSWDVEPAWNADTDDVDPGEGFRLPSGELMADTTILGPGPSYDPQRATFNQWISEWMREMGMPVESELTGFNTILNPVFVDATFDIYILGWGLGLYPDHLCDFFHSSNDTATSGNYNTPGHNDPEYDAVCDEFLASTDIEEARELAGQLQDILGVNLPYINLFYRQSQDLISRDVALPYTELLGGIAEQSGMQLNAIVTK